MATHRITILRHGKVDSESFSGGWGLSYGVAPDGRKSLLERRAKLGVRRFTCVLASNTEYALESAALIAGINRNEVSGVASLCPSLSIAYSGRYEKLRKHLNDAPYFQYEDASKDNIIGKLSEMGRKQILRYGTEPARDTHALVVGHYPLICGYGLQATKEHLLWEQELSETFFRETEGYTMIFEGDRDDLDLVNLRYHQG